MQDFQVVLAYFGPDVQLPVISFIAAATGFLLTIGRAPVRVIRQWIEARKGASKAT